MRKLNIVWVVLIFLAACFGKSKAADEKSEWLARLESNLLKNKVLPIDLDPSKLIAIYSTSPSCGPCKNVTDALLSLRKHHHDKIQIVLLCKNTSKEDVLKYWKEGIFNCPILKGDDGYEYIGQDGTPSLSIYAPDGLLLCSDADSLLCDLADPDEVFVGKENKKNAFATAWGEIIEKHQKDLVSQAILEGRNVKRVNIADTYSNAAFYPLYQLYNNWEKWDSVEAIGDLEQFAKTHSDPFNAKAFEDAVNMLRDSQTRKSVAPLYWKSKDMFSLAGRLSANDKSAVELFRQWTETGDYYHLKFGQRARVGNAVAGNEAARKYVQSKIMDPELRLSWEWDDNTSALAYFAGQKDEWSIEQLVGMRPDRGYGVLFAYALDTAARSGDDRIAKAIIAHAKNCADGVQHYCEGAILRSANAGSKVAQQFVDENPKLRTLLSESKVGEAAPEFFAKNWLNTRNEPSIKTLEKNVIVLQFWEDWGSPCNEIADRLNKIIRTYTADGVVVLALSEASRQEIKNAVGDTPIDFAYGVHSHSKGLYGVKGIPTTFVIEPGGKILWKGGYWDEKLEDVLKDAVEKMLKTRTRVP